MKAQWVGIRRWVSAGAVRCRRYAAGHDEGVGVRAHRGLAALRPRLFTGRRYAAGDWRMGLECVELAIDDVELAIDGGLIEIDDVELAIDDVQLAIDGGLIEIDDVELAIDDVQLAIDDVQLAIDDVQLAIDGGLLGLDDTRMELYSEVLSIDYTWGVKERAHQGWL
jgi:hypothetical protein